MNSNVTTQEAIRKASIRQTFETVASGYGRGSTKFFHDAGDVIVTLKPMAGNECVLDVACGTGATTVPLARSIPKGRVTAADFSPGMLAQAKTRAQAEGLGNIDFEVQDMTALPYRTGSFDRAYCSFGIFFVDDMAKTLEHIASKVRQGGCVLTSSFTGDSFMPLAELALSRLQAYGVELPEQKFGWKSIAEPEQLTKLFADAGLKNVEIIRKSLGYYIDVDGWWNVMWNAGYRGLIDQLGEQIESFRNAHLSEVRPLADSNGIWLEIDVNFACGYVE